MPLPDLVAEAGGLYHLHIGAPRHDHHDEFIGGDDIQRDMGMLFFHRDGLARVDGLADHIPDLIEGEF